MYCLGHWSELQPFHDVLVVIKQDKVCYAATLAILGGALLVSSAVGILVVLAVLTIVD